MTSNSIEDEDIFNVEDDDDDSDSISTIEDAMDTIDIDLDRPASADKPDSPGPSKDVSLESNAWADSRQNRSNSNASLSPPKMSGATISATHRESQENSEEAPQDMAAFDVSFRAQARRENKNRLRRTKSMPMPCSSRRSSSDLTPNKSYSDELLGTQATPLRRDLLKIESGRDPNCDWGQSVPACGDAIHRLLDMHKLNRANTTGGMATQANGVRLDTRASPVVPRAPITAAVNGSLLSPQDTGFKNLMPCPSSSVGALTPFSATFKYLSPLVNSLMRSPLSLLPPIVHRCADSEIINEDSISLARKALRNFRLPTSDSTTSSALEVDTSLTSAGLDRKKSRNKKSQSKWRRVSVGINNLSMLANSRDTSLSPFPVSKATNRRLSLSSNISDTEFMIMGDVSLSMSVSEPEATMVNYFIMIERQRSRSVKLSTANFKGVVIGGTYQNCFENGMPVVAPPSSSEKRAVALRLCEEGLELDMYIAKDMGMRPIKLGSHWCSMRTSPDGYLVFKETVETKKFVCYYLPRDPLDWLRGDRKSSTPKKVKFLHDMNEEALLDEEAAGDIYRSEMECSGISEDDPSREEEEHEDDMSTDATDNMSSSVSLQHDSYDVELEEARTVVDWNRSSIVSLVLEFLMGSSNGARGGMRRRRADERKQQLMLSSLQEVFPCRLVSKDWALGYYRLLARNLSDAKLSIAKDYGGWSDFVRRYSAGKFLSSGACKNVYSVQTSYGTEAVSVMNVNDLADRGMDLAISQELEISMLCSSLLDLHICPNLVKIHSVFQAAYDAPDELWRRGNSKAPSFLNIQPVIPKANQLVKGNYQYIRMEFCRGGDVEETVRRDKQLDVITVQTMLFQMLLAIYTCREKLALRHFDIKLLNFFSTTSAALLSSDGRNESRTASTPFGSVFGPRDCPIQLNIGFGDKIFTLPLRQDECDVIKLADFGTSVIGAGTLGDRIDVSQVH
jgi:hypothetical protein